jgi:transposase
VRDWSEQDDEAIIRMTGLGLSAAKIANHLGATSDSVYARMKRIRQLRGDVLQKVRPEEGRQQYREEFIALTAKAILRLLMRGGSYTAQEITALVKNECGLGWVWDALMKMEREHLVWRAHHFDWKRAHHWEITGCGRIVQQTPGA